MQGSEICASKYTWTYVQSLQALVNKERSKTDVLRLSETHIVDRDESDYAGFFKIDGYKLIKIIVTISQGEGVAMYIKNSIKFKWRQDLESPLLEIIEIFRN